LQTVAFFECGLHGVQSAIRLGQTFDGGDLLALDLAQQHIARLHGVAVHNNGARTTLRGIATHMGAREFEIFSNGLHQQSVGRGLDGHGLAVDMTKKSFLDASIEGEDGFKIGVTPISVTQSSL
jgi:hypothetical protein